MALCLFSYLGVETAAVAAAKVRDPDKNVPRATVFGTLGTAVVYLLSLTAVFGIVSSAALAESSDLNPDALAYLNRLSDLLFVLARNADGEKTLSKG